jgi:hypothetical protein
MSTLPEESKSEPKPEARGENKLNPEKSSKECNTHKPKPKPKMCQFFVEGKDCPYNIGEKKCKNFHPDAKFCPNNHLKSGCKEKNCNNWHPKPIKSYCKFFCEGKECPFFKAGTCKFYHPKKKFCRNNNKAEGCTVKDCGFWHPKKEAKLIIVGKK